MPIQQAPSIDWVQIIIAITAVLALIQPWLIAGYKKLFKKSVINCVRNRTMFVYFKSDGLFLNIFFTFIAKNSDDVITNATIDIFKKDKKLYTLEWFRFSDPANNSFVSGRNEYLTQQSSIDAHPIYLVNNMPKLYKVYFTDNELRNEMSECRTLEDGMTKMLLVKGSYDLNLTLYNAKGKKFISNYCFSISDVQYSLLKKNIGIMFDKADTQKDYQPFDVELSDRMGNKN